jgi:hypothetical protein
MGNCINNSKQINKLKIENELLQNELHDKRNNNEYIYSDIDWNKQSKIVIEKFIIEIMKNKNLHTVPDFIEKKIYENLLAIVINSIKDALEKSNIKLINHNVIIKVVPDI